jgi:predicted transposase/invertase (TIGR01784 family)
MAIGIDPTIDFAFKKLLGSPDHPAITLHFLNAILGGDPWITEVEILNPIQDKNFDGDKESILDVLARDDQGRLLNIEMQTTLPAELPERLAYYVSSLFVGQIGEGDSYQELRPAIGICVLDRILFRSEPQLHLDFRLRTGQTGASLTDHLQIHLLELPKYQLPGDNESITNPIEEWAFFFRQVQHLTAAEVAQRLGDGPFTEAAGVLEMIARNPKERSQYEARLKMQRDQESRLRAARDQGRAEGEAEGEARGRAVGELLGRIRLLHSLLRLPEPSSLDSMSTESLTSIESDLQQRLRNRG